MPDPAAEFRHLVEHVIQQVVSDQQAARGWDAGYNAAVALQMSTSIPMMGSDSELALEFATGYDPVTGTTIVGFTFDFSALDSGEPLL